MDDSFQIPLYTKEEPFCIETFFLSNFMKPSKNMSAAKWWNVVSGSQNVKTHK